MEQHIISEVERLRKNFASNKTLSAEWRKKQLSQLILMCKNHRMEIAEALKKDLGNPVELANISEIGATIQEANYALKNLDSWMAPEKKKVPITIFPGSGYVYKQPFGVVCIISPWNYPFRLLTYPLIGAIAAGNAVLMKPSEVSANTSAIIGKLIPQYLDKDFFSVIEGDATVSSKVLEQKFDYILYTGNTEVGRIVMKAAAENLTPVTLELGGKSPVIVDKSCNIGVTANRIVFGKFTNTGQTCVAPDYILVHKDIKEKFVKELKEKIIKGYSDEPEKAPYYPRIINERHTKRIQGYIEEVKSSVVLGGKSDSSKRFVEPTVVYDPPMESKMMQEEIFGPVLPIKEISSIEEGIQIINSRPKPLALYIFAEDDKVVENIIHKTSSGGVCVNGAIVHIMCPEIAFGGVGLSGMGGYNGKHSFDTFTHRRAVVKRSTWLDPSVSYPPFTQEKLNQINKVADGIEIPTKAIVGVVAVAAVAGSFIVSKL